MDIFSSYQKDVPYLVAVSGGPDSMALLNMLYEANFSHLLVALVNYKKRKESDEEESLVRNYCQNRKIPFFKKDYIDNGKKGSFQAKAREFRYAFFAEIYKKFHCFGLFVAHQKDDLIETYVLKQKRKVINESYLILPQAEVKNMRVYRPLLNIYKKELEEYCKVHHLPYGIDMSNFLPLYTRNQIRLDLTLQDKEKMYEEAIQKEEQLQQKIRQVQDFITTHNMILKTDLQDKDDLFLQLFLYYKIDRKYRKEVHKSLLCQLKNFLQSSKSNLSFCIKDNYYLIQAYEQILFSYIDNEPFCYEIKELSFLQTPHFLTQDTGKKMEGIYLEEQDFPIFIRSYKKDDKIKLKDGYKKVSRLFIDKKIPLHERMKYPLIENQNHEILFVYHLYRNYERKNSQNNYFVLIYK